MKTSTSRSYSSLADGFYGFLTREVDNLHSLFRSENSTISIKFLQQLVSSLRSIHSEITLLVQRLDLPFGDKWFDDYMDQSTRLLGASRIFKSAVTSMARYYTAVTISILPLIADHGDFDALRRPEVYQASRQCQEEMETLERDNKVLSETRAQELCLYFDPNINNNVVAEPEFNRYNGFCGAILATKTITTLLLAILLSGLVYFFPETSYFSTLPETSYFSQGAYEEHEVFGKDFVSSTVALHRSVSKVISGCNAGILAHELQSLALAVRELRMTRKAMGQMKVSEMQRCVKVLKGWAPEIIQELDEVVDEIIDARKMIRTCVFKL